MDFYQISGILSNLASYYCDFLVTKLMLRHQKKIIQILLFCLFSFPFYLFLTGLEVAYVYIRGINPV